MKTQSQHRRGVALLCLLVLLVAIVAVLGTLTWTTFAHRQFHAQRLHRLQAEWLARGGIERARAQAARGDTLAKGDWRPLGERSLVVIDVQTKNDGREVRSEASFPADEPRPVTREVTAIIPNKTK